MVPLLLLSGSGGPVLFSLVPADQSRPERALGSETDLRKFFQRKAYDRRAEHRDQREILHRIIQNRQQREDVRNLGAIVKASTSGSEGNVKAREFPDVELCFRGRRTK